MSLPKNSNANNMLQLIYKSAADETKYQVGSVPSADGPRGLSVYGLIVENPNTSEIFIQFFNRAIGDVTVGTTAPDWTIGCPASGKLVLDMIRPFFHASKGLVCAVTSGRATNGAITTDATISYYVAQN